MVIYGVVEGGSGKDMEGLETEMAGRGDTASAGALFKVGMGVVGWLDFLPGRQRERVVRYSVRAAAEGFAPGLWLSGEQAEKLSELALTLADSPSGRVPRELVAETYRYLELTFEQKEALRRTVTSYTGKLSEKEKEEILRGGFEVLSSKENVLDAVALSAELSRVGYPPGLSTALIGESERATQVLQEAVRSGREDE